MRPQRGFTLIELLLTITVLGVVLALGVPAFGNLSRDNRAGTELNGLVGLIHVARSSAVKYRAPVTVCPSKDAKTCDATANWSDGAIAWVLWNDPTDSPDAGAQPLVVRVLGPMHPNTTVSAFYSSFALGSRGRIDASVGDPMTTYIVRCDDRGLDKARFIELRQSGQARVVSSDNKDTVTLRTTHQLPNGDAASCGS